MSQIFTISFTIFNREFFVRANGIFRSIRGLRRSSQVSRTMVESSSSSARKPCTVEPPLSRRDRRAIRSRCARSPLV